MAEPTIICPRCKNEIKLNESLAAPLIESTRQEYEKRLAQKDDQYHLSRHVCETRWKLVWHCKFVRVFGTALSGFK